LAVNPTSWIPLTGPEPVAGETDNPEEMPSLQSPEKHALVRPRHAASLLIVDRSNTKPRVLMGQRSTRHAFFPQTYVFPGGRLDLKDSATVPLSDLREEECLRMQAVGGSRLSARRCRALGVAAVRETYEETGLMIGAAEASLDIGFKPDLSQLRYLARAVTPPRQVRRFDTHFFMLFTDDVGINPDLIRSSEELENLTWLDIDQGDTLPMPDITRKVLADLQTMVENTALLPDARQIPYYYARYGRFVRELL
jgi:8-oxo-dGTP pyrophosphatase MutT (NUDIX family)